MSQLSEIQIYAECVSLGMTPAGAAGATANILEESAGRSNNLQDSYNNAFNITDEEYVRQVDAGIRRFEDSAGFGYCQWTSNDRKGNLKSYLDGHGKSIADSNGQFQFMAREMRGSYAYVWSILTTTDDPFEAGYIMCKRYEIPANTEAQSQRRGNLAKQIYQRCSGTAPAKENEPSKDDGVDRFWPPRVLCINMNGADVYVLQALLLAHGYSVTTINGVFGISTDKAVRQYQADNGLAVDGIAGPKTFDSLTRR